MWCPEIGNRFNVNQRVKEKGVHTLIICKINHCLIKANKQITQSAIYVLSSGTLSQDGNTKEDYD